MTCDEVVQLLTEYMEDRLEPHVMNEVRTHIGLCEDCQLELQAETALNQWLTARPTEPVSADFVNALMDKLGLATPQPPRWFDSVLDLSNYWAPALAAALVVIFAAIPLSLIFLISIWTTGQSIKGSPMPASENAFTPMSAASSTTSSILS